MALLASDVLDIVSTKLLDPDRIAWTLEEQLADLNMGILAILDVKPEALAEKQCVQLTAGPRQTLPAGSIFLLENRMRNLGTDGVTPGSAILMVEREDLDQADPNWYNAELSDVVQNYTYDDTEPLVFWVYPPSTGANWVELVPCVQPAAVTGLTDVLPVIAAYQYALVSFVLAWAYAKNDKRQDLTKYTAFMNDFRTSLGLKTQAEGRTEAKGDDGSIVSTPRRAA